MIVLRKLQLHSYILTYKFIRTMHCLSQFCCFCIRNKVQLKLLHEITSNDTIFPNIVNRVIPEIGLIQNLSVCEGCTKYVTEIHTFRENCIRNNQLLVEYIELASGRNEDLSDLVARMKMNLQKDCKNELELEVIKEEMPEDPLQGLGDSYDHVHCNETTINEPIKEEVEVNDEFNNKYFEHEESDNLMESRELSDDEKSTSSKTVPKLYICEICGKFFHYLSKFKQHYSTHTVEKNHKCELCGKSFCLPYDLKRHSLIHSEEKPYKCGICGKSFTHYSYFKNHNTVHSGERLYECKTCGKSYKTKKYLQEHVLIHAKTDHQCSICRKSFPTMSELLAHGEVHASLKKYECETCGKFFKEYQYLKSHYMVHTGEKPHKCDLCGKCFTRAYGLKMHLVLHTSEKSYGCDVCGKSFYILGRLKKHKEKIHALENGGNFM